MTEELIDQHKILTDLSERAIERIVAIGETTIKEYWARHKNRDISTYTEYLSHKSIQASAVRNFIYQSKSASLHEIYVPTMMADNVVTGDQIIQDLCKPVIDPTKRPTRAFAIVGNAGAGKSLFMKHAFFEIQRIDAKRIPILVEVRSFNRVPLADLETRIFEDFVKISVAISREQIANGLRSGLFIILLDGMDELKGKIQAYYHAALAEFIVKYTLCPILVSSRPTEKMRPLDLTIVPISPLSLSAACDLISRLDFDETIKNAFISIMEEKLFRTHYGFVSNPLLCVIMLLTFSDSGRIAKNRHEFFEDAFLALWSKHDSRKEGFERDHYTGLQKNESLRILSAFSISSYSRGDFEIRQTQFHRYFEEAVRLSGVTCKEDDFFQDATVSTSILVEDGPYIRFCHRAFQEYFSAVFISEADDSFVGQLIEEISDRLETDSVLPMVLSINEEKIEKHWVMPKTRLISKIIDKTKTNIEEYEIISMGDDKSNSEVSEAMDKLRSLYQFDPSTTILRAAYDAAHHMVMTVKRLTKQSSSKGGIFERDQNNFHKLDTYIRKKYEHRSSALQDLLGRLAGQNPPAHIKDEGEIQ